MKTRTKWTLIICGGLAVCGAAAAGYFGLRPAAPKAAQVTAPVATAAPQDIAKYMASDDFTKLTMDQQKAFLMDIHTRGDGQGLYLHTKELPLDVQKTIQKNVEPAIRKLVEERVDGYFKTPPDQQRAYLDKVIDENKQANRRAAEAGTAAGRRPPAGPPGIFESQDKLREAIEKTEPLARAKFIGFAMAITTRMKERGEIPGH